MRKCIVLCAVVSALFVHAPSFADERLVGVTYSGEYIEIGTDPVSSTVLNDTLPTRLNSLAHAVDGSLLTVQGPLTNNPQIELLTLNPNTGNTIGSIPLPSGLGIRGMAQHADGRIFASVARPENIFGPFDLVEINPITGSTSTIGTTTTTPNGSTPPIDISSQSLEFDANGTLFGWSSGQGLVSINLSSAITTRIGTSTTGNTLTIQSLAFNSNGDLFGVNAFNDLYSIDPVTGIPSLIGRFAFGNLDPANDIRGITFIPSPGTVSARSTSRRA